MLGRSAELVAAAQPSRLGVSFSFDPFHRIRNMVENKSFNSNSTLAVIKCSA